MTHRNAPAIVAPPAFGMSEEGFAASDLPMMQDDSLHWNGEPVALVLAETQEQADHAASRVGVTYETEPFTAFSSGIADARRPDSIIGAPTGVSTGDAEQALADAPHRVDVRFSTPFHNHNAIEPHAVTLFWSDGELHVHDASQALAMTAVTLAACFSLDPAQVHVSSPFVGGGFGGKMLGPHQILAAAAARVVERPVRCTLSREGVYRIIGGRAATEQRVALGADDEGRLQALIHTGVSAMTEHNALPEPFTFAPRCLYAAANVHLDQQVVDVDMLANFFMRAPGEAVGTFALEAALDELAEELGIDPVELRARNEPERDPTTGEPFSQRDLVGAYRAGAERFGWSERRAPGTRREGEWLVGLGCATATYPYQRFPGAAARATIDRVGHVTIEAPAADMGMGTSTTQTIIAAERFGLPMELVTVAHGDSAFPGSLIAGGSSQTASLAAAIVAAHRAVITELLGLLADDSPLAGLGPDEVGCRDGGLCDLSDPERFETYAGILERADRDAVTVTAQAADPEEAQSWSMHSYGAVFCEARVNTVTGEPRVTRVLGSYDCGRILNARTAASQFRGGIIMGIGMALMERTELDERANRIMNPSLAEYHIPVHSDVPHIDVIWSGEPDPHAPVGARGIGEIGITGVAAAIANAIHNATGRRIRELPITLDKLL